MPKTLYLTVPCYKEEEVLSETAKRLLAKFTDLMAENTISSASKIVFINDGSKDKTWEIICELHASNPVFVGINLSRNKGHQNALLAGLIWAKDNADAVISMDADLQDDINAVDEMWAKFNEGFDVVYGVRSKRTTDTFFKRFSAEGFYKIMGAMGVDIVFNHADYRLMSQRALQTLSEFNEVNLFLRGVVPMIGYPSTTVMYERAERFAGETKYPLSKMLMLAIEGITSLSIRPIRLITVIGFLSFLISLIILVYSIVDRLTGGTVEGWASIIVSIWAIGGLQLLAIGIIGEYIGKVYLEVKARPKYVIQDIVARDIAKINIDISDNVSEEK